MPYKYVYFIFYEILPIFLKPNGSGFFVTYSVILKQKKRSLLHNVYIKFVFFAIKSRIFRNKENEGVYHDIFLQDGFKLLLLN